MAYQVLARKYRPLRFSDVVGQDHVTRTLLNALSQDRIAHGYIFSGHRGIGKTTIARILASALNCRNAIGSPERPTPEPCNVCDSCLEIRQGNSVDVIEIDAATNRGIDEIRELRDAARYRPARDRFKIYILDEAHQITDAAFNALLKTLEEPPDHIVFMMATTQPEDIPQTIRSRCQHFSFHAVKLDDIVGQLRLICEKENIIADEATLALLAEAGDGSMRDALSIMDQAIASAPIPLSQNGEPAGRSALEIEQVRELMGSVSNAIYEEVLEAVGENSSVRVLTVIGRLLDAGNGASQIARQFVRYLRNTLVAKISGLSAESEATGVAAELLQISAEERHRAARSAALFSEEELSRFLSIMLRTFDELGYRQEQRFHLELGLLKLVHAQRLIPIEEVLSQLGATASSPRTLSTATSTPAAVPRATSPAPVAARSIQASAPVSPQRIASPFEADRNRRVTSERADPAPSMSSTEGSLALAEPQSISPERAAPQLATDRPHLVVAPTPIAAHPFPDAEALQSLVVDALSAAKGHQSAADTMHDATWSLAEGKLTIQTAVSKQMLDTMLNREATQIVKTVLAQHASGLQWSALPGALSSTASAPKPLRTASAGSAADLAAKHPLVQEAQRLFQAEITNVRDLRDKP